MRPFLRPFPALLSVGCVVLAAACSDSSSGTAATLDPPRLSIDSIDAAGAKPWVPGSCLQAGTDPARTISINVGPADGAGASGRGGHLVSPPGRTQVSWTMSPPLSCSGTPPCGFLVLSVYTCSSLDEATCSKTSVRQIVAATTSIAVRMSDLPTGFFKFHIELKNQDGSDAKDAAGARHPAELVVEVSAQCGPGERPPPDAGKDAAPGDAVAPPASDARVPGVPEAAPPTPEAAPPPPPPDATTPVDGPAGPLPEGGTPPPADAAPVPTDAIAHD